MERGFVSPVPGGYVVTEKGAKVLPLRQRHDEGRGMTARPNAQQEARRSSGGYSPRR